MAVRLKVNHVSGFRYRYRIWPGKALKNLTSYTMLNSSPSQKTPLVVFSILAAHVLILLGLLIPGGCGNNTPSDISMLDEESESSDGFGLKSEESQADLFIQDGGETIPDITADFDISPEDPNTGMPTENENTATPGGNEGIASATVNSTSQPEFDEYVVAKGDNFSTIIRKFDGLRVSDLRSANPDVDPARIQIGQSLKIPRASLAANRFSPSSKAPAKTEANNSGATVAGKVYRIQSGDTLSKVASLYNVTVASIQNANPNLDPLRLQVNQAINIPDAKSLPKPVQNELAVGPGQKLYTVSKGDNLFTIARINKTSVSEIQKENPNLDPRRLQLGQTIVIPAAKSEPVQSPSQPTVSGQKIYVVQSGDNLQKISKDLNVSVSSLMQHNNLRSTKIDIGQQLSVPSNELAKSEQN
jgi:LysM repeat protein